MLDAFEAQRPEEATEIAAMVAKLPREGRLIVTTAAATLLAALGSNMLAGTKPEADKKTG